MKLFNRVVFYLFAVVFAIALLGAGIYLTIPTHNTAATRFDAIVVLGYPASTNGTPTPEQRERVLEGVREYKAGVAPYLILSGAAAHNRYVEADVMAQLARSQGVPASAILEEAQAHNTIQNIYYSARIMHDHGWSSAEIVSSPSHLPRAALIANTLNVDRPGLYINWRTHAARWPAEYSVFRKAALYIGEARNCLILRFNGFPSSQFLPRDPAIN
ncbi:MAG TPA: YdcF family protein [Edaphobacter sp.]|nr:YdcF family protein [Edaphobacter sp.]